MIPPAPTANLANCVWLPRILSKARLIAAKELPESYMKLFCSPRGLDGLFLAHFELQRADIESLAQRPDPQAANAFLQLPSVTPAKIETWNQDAPNFGRPGYPLADVLPTALAERYTEIQHLKPQTAFEMLAADDERLRNEQHPS